MARHNVLNAADVADRRELTELGDEVAWSQETRSSCRPDLDVAERGCMLELGFDAADQRPRYTPAV